LKLLTANLQGQSKVQREKNYSGRKLENAQSNDEKLDCGQA